MNIYVWVLLLLFVLFIFLQIYFYRRKAKKYLACNIFIFPRDKLYSKVLMVKENEYK